MSKKMRERHPEGWEVGNRRAFLQVVAGAATAAAVAGAMPEIAAAQEARSLPQMPMSRQRMSKKMSMSDPRGGHLYMQTNEIRNAVVHYRWSASGELTEAQRLPTRS